MFYLDDFLELLEPFSVQFREELERIGDLDQDVRHLQGELKSKSDEMFKECDKKQKFGMNKDQIHSDPAIVQLFKEVKKLHNKIKEKSGEKARRMAELENKVDRCLRRCDSDLERFGNEMEAEQPGITEQLAENALNLEPSRGETKKEYETDEDDYQPTPRHRKPTHQRARRPSDRDQPMLSPHSPVPTPPPPKQRKLSLSAVSSSSSSSVHHVNAPMGSSHTPTQTPPHLARALSMPATVKSRADEFEETFGTSISPREGARPSRVKKLTEKGKDWAHSLNSKLDAAQFRIPPSPSQSSSPSMSPFSAMSSPVLVVPTASAGPGGELLDEKVWNIVKTPPPTPPSTQTTTPTTATTTAPPPPETALKHVK